MPEGDVVLRTALRLDAALTGHVLQAAELRWPTIAGANLAGRAVLGTVAVGKHLLTRFDDGRTLHTHLRMEGSWAVQRTTSTSHLPASARAVLVGPEWTCVGRRLGMMDLVRTRDEGAVVGHLGPDVLDPAWDRSRAVAAVKAQGDRPIADSLLDQRVVAGLGTIFMAESLWANRVWPWAPAGSVREAGAILDTARSLMQRSVAAPTPTATGDVRPGRETCVHGRLGRACPRCGSRIRRGDVGAAPQSRPAFYCPGCQRPDVQESLTRTSG